MNPFENTLSIQHKLIETIMHYGPIYLGAIIVLIIGLQVIKILTRILIRTLRARNLEVSLQSFLTSIANVSMKILLVVSVAGMVGIQTTSFVAVIGAFGLALGLALQGSLANFAGGVLTLLFKPFKIGDIIETQGQVGTVKDIQIFNTTLITPENKTVILANGAVTNGTIINYTKQGSLRAEVSVIIEGKGDIDKLKNKIITQVLTHEIILEDPQPTVGISKIDGNLITIDIKAFVSNIHHDIAKSIINEEVLKIVREIEIK